MEDVLDVYQRPFDPLNPVICMDEQPVQLIEEKRVPIEAEPGSPVRFDYEYRRKGTADVFIFTEALSGWRRVNIHDNKKGVVWAEEIRLLLEDEYPDAEKVVLVCDNYSTHTLASLYKAFPPEQARSLVKRLEFHYTPKHGSWLNIAEIELSALTRQCLDRRIPDLETLRSETKMWESARNANCKSVDWQFTTDDARIKLKKLYPQFKMK